MNTRACLLVALLASPAWSQAPPPAAEPPASSTGSFNLRDTSIKKIVRDAAATQYATFQLADKPAAKAEPVGTIRFVPPEPKVESKLQDVPRLRPDPAPGGFLSQALGIAIDEVLFDGNGTEAAETSDRWLRCEGRAPLKSTQLGYDTCPAKNGDRLSPVP